MLFENCLHFVLRYLTAVMCACRMNCSQENLEIFERVRWRSLQNFVTIDETPRSKAWVTIEWKLQENAVFRWSQESTSDVILADTWVRLDKTCSADQKPSKKAQTVHLLTCVTLCPSVPVQCSVDWGDSDLKVHRPSTSALQAFNLTPSNFFLLNQGKRNLRGQRFSTELKDAVLKSFWLLWRNFLITVCAQGEVCQSC